VDGQGQLLSADRSVPNIFAVTIEPFDIWREKISSINAVCLYLTVSPFVVEKDWLYRRGNLVTGIACVLSFSARLGGF
jgi:hypothetical protein